MAKERKIICDCGRTLEEKKVKLGHIETEAMVCEPCHFTTLTLQQGEKYMRLTSLHKILDIERKIIKIGNSMGITFPEQLQEYGLKVGKKVKLEALSPTAFKVEFTNQNI